MAEDEGPEEGREENAFQRAARRAQENSAAMRGRGKLDGEAFAAQRAERRRAKAERPKRDGTKLRRGFLAAAVVLGVLASCSAVMNEQAAFAQQSDRNAGEIASLRSQIDLARMALDQSREAEPASSSIAEDAAQAQTNGDAAAASQNRMNALAFAEASEAETGNGSAKPSLLAGLQEREALAPLFADTALPADDKVVYSPGSTTGLQEGDADPRFPWFTKSERDEATGAIRAADPAGYTWRVESVMPVDQDARTFDVLWAAIGTDGTLYAWAKSGYSAEAGQFIDFEITTTILGDNATPGKGL